MEAGLKAVGAVVVAVGVVRRVGGLTVQCRKGEGWRDGHWGELAERRRGRGRRGQGRPWSRDLAETLLV